MATDPKQPNPGQEEPRQAQDARGKRPPAPLRVRLFTNEGKPLRVLSTSLGIALLANAMMAPAAFGEAAQGTAGEPKLVEWSSDAVKSFFDPSTDWNIPLPPAEGEQPEEDDGAGTDGGSGGSGGGSTVVYAGGGFGWDDLLLYHLLFNSGGMYSSRSRYDRYPTYDPRTGRTYKPRSFDSETFRNKPTVGSAVRPPKTSSGSGSITRRSGSTSSPKGGIGGKSGGFTSSSGSKSSGGFGG